jgi:L-fucose isomerase-like protein
METIRVGIFSPNDFRPWVRESNQKALLAGEAILVESLRAHGIEVVRGGEGLAEEDQIAWNTGLVRRQARRLAEAHLDAFIINHGDWSWPYDARDAVQIFAQSIQGKDHGVARVLIYCHKEPEVPGLVAGMASGGAFRRIALPYRLVSGRIDRDPAVLEKVLDILRFFKRRSDAVPTVRKALDELCGLKYLALGGMSLKMCTGTADVDQWAKKFGISYDALDQSELTRRAIGMIRWSGRPGKSDILEVTDSRVAEALDYLHGKGHGCFDFSREKLKDIRIFAHQLAFYYAAVDVKTMYDADFLGIKCQDELSGLECTQCIATAFLNNDCGPDGKAKAPVPVSCENDMDSSLTQMILHLLNGRKPAGFGDFRDIEDGVLAIVNCGQHPPYFFGPPKEAAEKKLNRTEYMGQEVWYHAGGSSVRGRTPGGQVMTVARLYRENLRYALVAMPVETVTPSPEVHNRYSISWPVILAKTPIGDEQVIDLWPCNHLGFCYGDYTAELVELAERLDIGYTVYDRKGNVFHKAS